MDYLWRCWGHSCEQRGRSRKGTARGKSGWEGIQGRPRGGGGPGEGETQGRKSFKEEKTPSTWLGAEQDEAQNWPSEHRKEQISHEERTRWGTVRADAAEREATVWRMAFLQESGGTQSLYKVYVNR